MADATASMQALPRSVLAVLTTRQLMVAYGFDLHAATIQKLRHDLLGGGAVARRQNGANAERRDLKRGPRDNRVPATEMALTLERIARINSKTEPVLGAGEQLSERDAVILTVRELKAFDPTIIHRNIKRALPKTEIRSQTSEAGQR